MAPERESTTSAKHDERPKITIYTDGACSGNPGPGGYGIVLLDATGRRREVSAGFSRTTNNRMELSAAIVALETLTIPCSVTLHSDSRYVVDAIEKGWLKNWRSKGWKKSDRKPVLNLDLWQRLVPQLERHHVKFKWVEGHAGNVENERCDVLAVEAAHMPDLKPDIAS